MYQTAPSHRYIPSRSSCARTSISSTWTGHVTPQSHETSKISCAVAWLYDTWRIVPLVQTGTGFPVVWSRTFEAVSRTTCPTRNFVSVR
jgi:hypothetical protein